MLVKSQLFAQPLSTRNGTLSSLWEQAKAPLSSTCHHTKMQRTQRAVHKSHSSETNVRRWHGLKEHVAVAEILEEIWHYLKIDVEGSSQSIHKCDSHWHAVNIGRTESNNNHNKNLFLYSGIRCYVCKGIWEENLTKVMTS